MQCRCNVLVGHVSLCNVARPTDENCLCAVAVVAGCIRTIRDHFGFKTRPLFHALNPTDVGVLIECWVAAGSILVQQRVRIGCLTPKLHHLKAFAVWVIVKGGVSDSDETRDDFIGILRHGVVFW